MSHRAWRAALVALVVAGSFLIAPAASGTVTSGVVGGVLSAAGDDNDDSIVIGCLGGEVAVNGADPLSGVALCSDIIAIVVDGGGGSDLVTLEAVSPIHYTSVQSITVRGGEGDDTLIGSDLDESIYGGPGDDALYPHDGTEDLIFGDGGFDEVRVVAAPDLVLTDVDLVGTGMFATLREIESALLMGGSEDNTIDASGFSSPTQVDALGGQDVVIGGSSRDLLSGSDGNDMLFGGPGGDRLRGQDGDDQLFGGDGADRIRGGPGSDACRSGPGRDVVKGCE